MHPKNGSIRPTQKEGSNTSSDIIGALLAGLAGEVFCCCQGTNDLLTFHAVHAAAAVEIGIRVSRMFVEEVSFGDRICL